MINQEWKIKSRAHACSVTGRPFVDGESMYAALYEDPGDDGFVRRDYSVEAWEERRSEPPPFSYWRSTYEAPPADPGRTEIVEKENTESFLRRLIDEDEPTTENTRFILALMLERKKSLRETDSRSLGQARLRIYEHTKTGEVFIIRDPMLRLDELETIQREVTEWLANRSGAGAATEAEGNRAPAPGAATGDPGGESPALTSA